MTKAMPYVLMGAKPDAIYEALTTLPEGAVDATYGGVDNPTTVWAHLQETLNTPGIAQYFGGYAQELNWDQFVKSGATMGELWMQNPNKAESQHWGFVYQKNDIWYFQDPWNRTAQGVFGTWGVKDWTKIKTYKIRPIEVVVPKKE